MLKKEVKAPNRNATKDDFKIIVLSASVALLFAGTIIFFMFRWMGGYLAPFPKVPVTHEIRSVNTDPAWQGKTAEGKDIYVMPPENCLVYRGEHVTVEGEKGEWVLVHYSVRDSLRKDECPMNTLFFVRRSELQGWSDKYESIAEDEADKAYLLSTQH